MSENNIIIIKSSDKNSITEFYNKIKTTYSDSKTLTFFDFCKIFNIDKPIYHEYYSKYNFIEIMSSLESKSDIYGFSMETSMPKCILNEVMEQIVAQNKHINCIRFDITLNDLEITYDDIENAKELKSIIKALYQSNVDNLSISIDKYK